MALTLATKIAWLKAHGSSLSLNWGEDTGCWECSWISSGKRRTVVTQRLETALDALLKGQGVDDGAMESGEP